MSALSKTLSHIEHTTNRNLFVVLGAVGHISAMGAFLSKKLKWSGPGKLDDTEENVVTFRLVFRRLALLAKAMPDIAAIPFEPLVFDSVVIPADFKGND